MTATAEQFPVTMAERLIELDRAREALLAELGDGSIEPPPSTEASRWSIGEIAYHLYLVETRISALLKKVLGSDKRNEIADQEKLRTEWELTYSRANDKELRSSAPQGTIPENAPRLSETLTLLKKSRTDLLSTVGNWGLDEFASISIPHPIEAIGSLTGAGWLSLVAHHEIRHTRQIRDIKAKAIKTN